MARNEISRLAILHKLVDMGNPLVVVEDNRDVNNSADWVIDLDPEGDAAGGQIIEEANQGR